MFVCLVRLIFRNFHFLQSSQEFRNASQILQSLLIPRTFAKAPQMGQHLVRYASALIRDSYNYVLGCLAYENLNRWWCGVTVLLLRNDGLYRVSDELTDDIFQMALNVRKGSIKMAFDANLGNLHMRAVGGFDQFLGRLAAALYDLFGIALEEDFADGVVVWIVLGLDVWKMPWRVEGVGQRQMLLCNNTAGDALLRI